MSHRLSVIHKPPIAWTLLETAVGAFLVFGIDVLTGSDISVGVFYLFPVFRGAWKGGRASVIVVGILCAILWIAADLNSGRIHPSQMIVYWNAMVRFGYIFSVAYLSLRLREEQDAHILM